MTTNTHGYPDYVVEAVQDAITEKINNGQHPNADQLLQVVHDATKIHDPKILNQLPLFSVIYDDEYQMPLENLFEGCWFAPSTQKIFKNDELKMPVRVVHTDENRRRA